MVDWNAKMARARDLLRAAGLRSEVRIEYTTEGRSWRGEGFAAIGFVCFPDQRMPDLVASDNVETDVLLGWPTPEQAVDALIGRLERYLVTESRAAEDRARRLRRVAAGEREPVDAP